MPELPEVESIRNHLKRDIIGKVIRRVEVLTQKQFQGDEKKIVGHKIVDIVRHGKILAIKLDSGLYLNFHFKLTGQLLFAKDSRNAKFIYNIPLAFGNKMPGHSTRVIINFTDGSALYFNELRKFGWIKLTEKQERSLGEDVMTSKFNKKYFAEKLENTRRPIKIVLMDQDRFAGVGNIYASEALFDARLNPELPANSLTVEQSNHLYRSIIKVITQGIKHRGSSGKDEVYILPDGSKGEHQYHFNVYQQEGKPCKRCQTIIVRIKQGGRSSFFCPKCQVYGTEFQ